MTFAIRKSNQEFNGIEVLHDDTFPIVIEHSSGAIGLLSVGGTIRYITIIKSTNEVTDAGTTYPCPKDDRNWRRARDLRIEIWNDR